MDRGFDLGAGFGEFGGEAGQNGAVDQDPLALHGGEHRRKRALQRLVDCHLALRHETRPEQHPEAERDVGILGRILRRAVERYAVESQHVLAGARDFLEGDRLVAEMLFGKLVHAMAILAGFDGVGHEHRVVEIDEFDPGLGEDEKIVFEILPDLEDRGILQQGLQRRDRVCLRDLLQRARAAEIEPVAGAMADGDVARLARRQRQRDARELRLHRIERSRFGIDTNMALLECGGDPAFQHLDLDNCLVVRVPNRDRPQGFRAVGDGMHARPPPRRARLWPPARVPPPQLRRPPAASI